MENNATITFVGNETALDQQNSTECVFVDSNAEKIIKLCACCFILLGSLIGNILIILIVYKHQELRKTINYFIVNMAVSDRIFPLILIPVQITQLVTEPLHWHVSGIVGSIFCKLYIFASSVSLLVSTQSLVWIAIDRFVAVVFPIKLGLISRKIRIIAIVSTWVLAGIFYFPLLITWELVEIGSSAFCRVVDKPESIIPNTEAGEGYYWSHVTLRFIAPLFLATILYSAIAISLRRQNKALTDAFPTASEQHYLKKRRQATQMAVVILVLFYICVIPYTALHISGRWKRFCAFWTIFQCLAIFMFFSSSIVNPVICLSFVETYRRGLKSILCPCSRVQSNNLVARRKQVTLKGTKSFREELQK